MTKTVSIITITYKDPQGLRATLESLRPMLDFGQPWEHIVVDSSPADNKAVLADLPRNWPLVHVQAPPKGVYPAFNAGLERAQGQYFWFLNGGDRLVSLATLAKAIETLRGDSLLDFVCAGAQLYRDGRYLYSRQPAENLFAAIVGSNRLCHQALVYRRSVFDRLGSFSTDLKIAGDYEHHFRCYAMGLKLGRVDGDLVVFDMGGVSGNYANAFSEFRVVHGRIRGRVPTWVSLANSAVWAEERAKIGVLKFFARSRAADALRPLWLAWNRRRER